MQRLSQVFTACRRSLTSDAHAANSEDCVVVGGGVIGLACARALTAAGVEDVMVIEAENSWGTQTSARHSEVIHAGIYYPAGSLKAQLCVEGKHMLYDYLGSRSIPHRRVSKLIVATHASQVSQLEALRAQAAANGVHDLQWLSGQEAMTLEPQLRAAAALLSPSTGIFDSHTYMSSLLAEAEAGGASLAVASKVTGGAVLTGGPAGGHTGVLLHVRDQHSGESVALHARMVVNAAGLWAQHVSRSIAGVPASSIPRQYLARGVYFTLASAATFAPPTATFPPPSAQQPAHCPEQLATPARGVVQPRVHASPQPLDPEGIQPFPHTQSRPFSRLIYPLPQDGGLGVHLTLDLGGTARFGPDVEWVDRVEYTVDPGRGAAFEAAIRTYWPSLPHGALQPGYAGVRPKLSGLGQPAADFEIQGPAVHGVPGLVCLYGIESPGLTSSLAIAERVRQLLLGTP